MSTTKEVALAVVFERAGGSLLVDGHSADGIDCPMGCSHFVCLQGDVCLLLIILFHAMPTSSLRDPPHVPEKFPNAARNREEITLNLLGMTFAETNPQSCFAPKSGKYANGRPEKVEGPMKNLRLGSNFAVFLLFFGLSLLEAFQTRNWLKAAFWLAIAAVFLYIDRKRQPEAR